MDIRHQIDEAGLRMAGSKADGIVSEVATQDLTGARKVPEFLRTAPNLSREQWDQLIKHTDIMTSGKKSKRTRK